MPYYIFLKKGYLVDIVSIAGGKVPIDPLSVAPPQSRNAAIRRFIDDGEQFSHICFIPLWSFTSAESAET